MAAMVQSADAPPSRKQVALAYRGSRCKAAQQSGLLNSQQAGMGSEMTESEIGALLDTLIQRRVVAARARVFKAQVRGGHDNMSIHLEAGRAVHTVFQPSVVYTAFIASHVAADRRRAAHSPPPPPSPTLVSDPIVATPFAVDAGPLDARLSRGLRAALSEARAARVRCSGDSSLREKHILSDEQMEGIIRSLPRTNPQYRRATGQASHKVLRYGQYFAGVVSRFLGDAGLSHLQQADVGEEEVDEDEATIVLCSPADAGGAAAAVASGGSSVVVLETQLSPQPDLGGSKGKRVQRELPPRFASDSDFAQRPSTMRRLR